MPILRAPGDPPNQTTLDWLLEGDPSVRWQVMRDLTDVAPSLVERERGRVAREGWGAQLLSRQRQDGQWGDGRTLPYWWTNLYSMIWLRDLGVDPNSQPVQVAVTRVRERVTWGEWQGYSPFFEGEVEPCINGRVVALAAYFGERSDRLVDRLLSEQLVDGGWNCEAERGSVRSSFHTTICVLEGLLEYELAFGTDARVTEARRIGEEYLLERRLLRRLSTGDLIDAGWTKLAFPPLWHYDVLRALDYFRAARRNLDERMAEALETLVRLRLPSGRWLREQVHRDTLYDEFAAPAGEPSRWISLRAARVGLWFGVA